MQEYGNINDLITSTADQHYKKHLAAIYSWMSGDFNERCAEQLLLLLENDIQPYSSGIAIDLGSGHGIHSAALAKCGFSVIAIDLNAQLLQELNEHTWGWGIRTIQTDIRNIKHYDTLHPEVIVCGGDTIAHLNNMDELVVFMEDLHTCLRVNGTLLLSFRDYSIALTGDARFIPVKADDSKILTCVLDYEEQVVHVTDVLHVKTNNKWEQHVSSYNKLRISTGLIKELLCNAGFEISNIFSHNSMAYIIAVKT